MLLVFGPVSGPGMDFIDGVEQHDGCRSRPSSDTITGKATIGTAGAAPTVISSGSSNLIYGGPGADYINVSGSFNVSIGGGSGTGTIVAGTTMNSALWMVSGGSGGAAVGWGRLAPNAVLSTGPTVLPRGPCWRGCRCRKYQRNHRVRRQQRRRSDAVRGCRIVADLRELASEFAGHVCRSSGSDDVMVAGQSAMADTISGGSDTGNNDFLVASTRS